MHKLNSKNLKGGIEDFGFQVCRQIKAKRTSLKHTIDESLLEKSTLDQFSKTITKTHPIRKLVNNNTKLTKKKEISRNSEFSLSSGSQQSKDQAKYEVKKTHRTKTARECSRKETGKFYRSRDMDTSTENCDTVKDKNLFTSRPSSNVSCEKIGSSRRSNRQNTSLEHKAPNSSFIFPTVNESYLVNACTHRKTSVNKSKGEIFYREKTVDGIKDYKV